jgi:hypothetical protein
MYSNPCESAPLGLAWLPYQWRVDAAIPHIERPGQLCKLVGQCHDAIDQLWFVVRFVDGHESQYLPGDLIAEPVWGTK